MTSILRAFLILVSLVALTIIISRDIKLPSGYPRRALKVQDKNHQNSITSATAATSGIAKAASSRRQINVNSTYKEVKKRFEERLTKLQEQCNRSDLVIAHAKPYKEITVASGFLNWCLMPKVGTSFMQQQPWVYGGPALLSENGSGFKSRSESQVSDLKSPIKSFVFVREPYSRLISGYLGKVLTNYTAYRRNYGQYLVLKYRRGTKLSDNPCDIYVTFPEFVKYFIHSQITGTMKDIHFRPQHEMCDLCAKPYHFIGHLETLKEDLPFILETAGVQINNSLNNDVNTLINKAKYTVEQMHNLTVCSDYCPVLNRTWWSLQARGFIANDIGFPLTKDQCNTITGEDFANLALDAYQKSVGHMNKSQQKRDHLVRLFLQVPLSDRIQVKNLLANDFEFFGYDPQPADIFPELQ